MRCLGPSACFASVCTSHGCQARYGEPVETDEDTRSTHGVLGSPVAHSDVEHLDAVTGTVEDAHFSKRRHYPGGEDFGERGDIVHACDCTGLHLREEDVVSIVKEVATRVIRERCLFSPKAFLCRNHELHCRPSDAVDTGTCCSSERSHWPGSCCTASLPQKNGSGRCSTRYYHHHDRQNHRHRDSRGRDEARHSSDSVPKRRGESRCSSAQSSRQGSRVPSGRNSLVLDPQDTPFCAARDHQSNRSRSGQPGDSHGHDPPDARTPSQQPSRQPSRQHSQSSLQPRPHHSRTSSRRSSRQNKLQHSRGNSRQPSRQHSRHHSPENTLHSSRLHSRQHSLQRGRSHSRQPSRQHSRQPSRHHSRQPSRHHSRQPSRQHSRQPSLQRIHSHSRQPSGQHSRQPSRQHSRQPSRQHSRQPSRQHSRQPSRQHSLKHSRHSNLQPSRQHSRDGSRRSSRQPIREHRLQPSRGSSRQPSRLSSRQRSRGNSRQPSRQHSRQPSRQHSRHGSRKYSRHSSQQNRLQHSRENSRQPSRQHSRQHSHGHTLHPSRQHSRQPSLQRIDSHSRQPSRQPSRQHSRQPSRQHSRQPSRQHSRQPSRQHSRQPSQQPSLQPSRQHSRQHSRDGSRKCSRHPSRQNRLQHSRGNSRQPSRQHSRQQGSEKTLHPSRQHSRQPSLQRSHSHSRQPSRQHSRQRSPGNSRQPSRQQSRQPSRQPSRQHSGEGSRKYSRHPSRQNRLQHSRDNSRQPSRQHSRQHSHGHTLHPSRQHSRQPSLQPSHSHSRQPSRQPSRQHSPQPSRQHSRQPSRQHSRQSSRQHSRQPSRQPSLQPSQQPSLQPSQQPSLQPSRQHSHQHSHGSGQRPSHRHDQQHSRQQTGQYNRQLCAQRSRENTDKPDHRHNANSSRQQSPEHSARPSLRQSEQSDPRDTWRSQWPPSRQQSRQEILRGSRQHSSQVSRQPRGQPCPDKTEQLRRRSSRLQKPEESPQRSRQPSSQRSRHPSRQPSRQRSRAPSRQASTESHRQRSYQSHTWPSRQHSRDDLGDNQQSKRHQSSNPSRQVSNQATRDCSALRRDQNSSYVDRRCGSQSTQMYVQQPMADPSSWQSTSQRDAQYVVQCSRQQSQHSRDVRGSSHRGHELPSDCLQTSGNVAALLGEKGSQQWSRETRQRSGQVCAGSEIPSSEEPSAFAYKKTCSPRESRQGSSQLTRHRRDIPLQERPHGSSRQHHGDIWSASSMKKNSDETDETSRPLPWTHGATPVIRVPGGATPDPGAAREPGVGKSPRQPTQSNMLSPLSSRTTRWQHEGKKRVATHCDEEEDSHRKGPQWWATRCDAAESQKSPRRRDRDSRRLWEERVASRGIDYMLNGSRPSRSQQSTNHQLQGGQPTALNSWQRSQPISKQDQQPSTMKCYTPLSRSHSRQRSEQHSQQPSMQHHRQPSRQHSRQSSRQQSRHPSRQHGHQSSRKHSREPSMQHSRQSSRQPSRQSSRQPSREHSRQHSRHPTTHLGHQPSKQHIHEPNRQPSRQHSTQPSRHHSRQHSRQPSRQHSTQPSRHHSRQHSRQPSTQHSRQPSRLHSRQHSRQPSRQNSRQPSRQHSRQSSKQHRHQASRQHSRQPSRHHSRKSSRQPSRQHSRQPSRQQSRQPSKQHGHQPSRQHSLEPNSENSRQRSSDGSGQPGGRGGGLENEVHTDQHSQQSPQMQGQNWTTQPSNNCHRQPNPYPSWGVAQVSSRQLPSRADVIIHRASSVQSKQPSTYQAAEHVHDQATRQDSHLQAAGVWNKNGSRREERNDDSERQSYNDGTRNQARYSSNIQPQAAAHRSLNSREPMELSRKSSCRNAEEPSPAVAHANSAVQRGLHIEVSAERSTCRQYSHQRSSSRQTHARDQSRLLSPSPSQTWVHAGIKSSGSPHENHNTMRQEDHHNHLRKGTNGKQRGRSTHLALPRNTLPLSRQNTYNGLVTPVEENDGCSDDSSAPEPTPSLTMRSQEGGQPGSALNWQVSSPPVDAPNRDRRSKGEQQMATLPAPNNHASFPSNSVGHTGDSRREEESYRYSSVSERPRLYYSSSQSDDSRFAKGTGSSSSSDFPPPDIDWETPQEQRSGLGSRLPSQSQNAAPDPYAFEKQLRSGQLSRLPSRDATSVGAFGSRRHEDVQRQPSAQRCASNRGEDGWSQYMKGNSRLLNSPGQCDIATKSDNHLGPSGVTTDARLRSSERKDGVPSRQVSRVGTSMAKGLCSVGDIASPLARGASNCYASTSRDPSRRDSGRKEDQRPQSNEEHTRKLSVAPSRQQSRKDIGKHSRQDSRLPSRQGSRQPSRQESRQPTQEQTIGPCRDQWSWQQSRQVSPVSSRLPADRANGKLHPARDTHSHRNGGVEKEAYRWEEGSEQFSHQTQDYYMMPLAFSNSVLHRGYYEEPYAQGPPLNVMQIVRSLKHSYSAPPVDAASTEAASPYFTMRRQSGRTCSLVSLSEDEKDMVHEITEHIIKFLKKKHDRDMTRGR